MCTAHNAKGATEAVKRVISRLTGIHNMPRQELYAIAYAKHAHNTQPFHKYVGLLKNAARATLWLRVRELKNVI
jgi:hypothetical protein